MSLVDKLAFLRNVLPNIIEIMNVILKCLKVIVDSENVK